MDDRIITPSDPEWSDHILSLIDEREMINGAPRVQGLRRVAYIIFDEWELSVIKSKTHIIHSGPDYVVAEHSLELRHKTNYTSIEYNGCVDVRADTLPEPYCRHLVATACTKAESKALRRALRVSLYTAEEMNFVGDESIQPLEKVNDQQIMAMGTLAKRNDVNLAKLIHKVNSKVKKIDDLSSDDAVEVLNTLSLYQRMGVDDEMKGYSSSWKSDLAS